MIDARRAETLLFCTLCATGLWGAAGRLLPSPFDDWYAIPYRIIGHRLVAVLPDGLSAAEKLALWQVIEGYVFALLLPLMLLRAFDVTPAQAGLRLPRRRGAIVTLAGTLLTLPIGFWLATRVDDPWGSVPQEALEFLILLPEHFLIFGVFGVLLMRERELAWPVRGLRESAGVLFAVTAVSVIFLLVHVGAPSHAEEAASFANGIIFAVMTVCSGSIWPAIIAHCTLNVIPMAVLAMT